MKRSGALLKPEEMSVKEAVNFLERNPGLGIANKNKKELIFIIDNDAFVIESDGESLYMTRAEFMSYYSSGCVFRRLIDSEYAND